MPGAAKTVAEMNSILGGTGTVTLAEAVGALTAASGLVVFTKKIGLWPKFTPVEQKEMELLDADMPSGWWQLVKERVPAVAFAGKRPRWRHCDNRNIDALGNGNSGWSIDQTSSGELLLITPIMDEKTGELI